MSRAVPVVNPGGDFEENIERLAKHLGQSKLRRIVFGVIYGRGSKPKSKRQVMAIARLPDAKSQQVQNELEHLQLHHLIVRIDNEGHVEDGARYVYEKDSFVSANREKIVRRADNKRLANRDPTKRRPKLPLREMRRLVIEKKDLRKRKKLTVLYLTASPPCDEMLRVDLEADLVRQAIRGSIYRNNIDVQFRQAANLDAIIEGLNDHRPQIVHFSGHSSRSAIAADNRKMANPGYREVPYELLAEAFQATDHPPTVVVLNSCESAGAKKALLGVVSVLIAMRTGVSDLAAASFAPKFYAAVASGQSVQAAFKQGVLAVKETSIGEKDTPELAAQSSVNIAKLVLT